MESVYHIVTIRVNETSWAHVWRLHSGYLGTGCDKLSGQEDRMTKRNLRRVVRNHQILQGALSPACMEGKVTWETEKFLRSIVPKSVVNVSIIFLCSPSSHKSCDEISFKGGGL
jgi:hypothetical protein